MDNRLSYKDDSDRCYGATGAAIGIVVFDGEDYIDHIHIDAPADSMIEFVPGFYFGGNPRISAKTAWNRMLQSYNSQVVSTLANVLCRTLVNEGMPVRYEVKQRLHEVVSEEGRDTCSLEDDEIERIFKKNYDYLMRVFSNRGVQEVAREMASELRTRRRMSRLEIIEQLRALSMI